MQHCLLVLLHSCSDLQELLGLCSALETSRIWQWGAGGGGNRLTLLALLAGLSTHGVQHGTTEQCLGSARQGPMFSQALRDLRANTQHISFHTAKCNRHHPFSYINVYRHSNIRASSKMQYH